MSYLALARKWRPHQFEQVVGQAHVLTALENALEQNRLHHAYLFSGTRGVGKTSIGRLLAKGLNCETGITARPCGQCDTCREIDEGRFVDLLEIDAASRTKVEDTRELLDNVQYKPARGRFKVYLIDEVHMLSRHSFNALLKTLEEPPEYVKFLLATTDPQKLPVTILSRCLQFHLKPIGVDQIQGQLEHILSQESVDAETRALHMMAHAADGSMRDALSLTDQAIALGNGKIEADIVSSMLGTLDTDQALHLLQAISSKDVAQAMAKIEELGKNGVDWDGLLSELSTQLHRIAMYQALPETLDKGAPDSSLVEILGSQLSAQDVQLYYQIAIKGRQDVSLAPMPRMGVEMLVLRMMAFRPVAVEASPVASVAAAAAPAPVNTIPVVNTAPAQPTVQQNSAPLQSAPVQMQATQSPASNVAPPPAEAPYGGYPQDSYPSEGYSQDSYQQDNHSAQGHPADYGQPMSAPAPQAPPQPAQASAPATPASPVAGLRHQLRSKRGQRNEGGTKKSNAAPVKKSPSTAMERLAQITPAKPVSPSAVNPSDPAANPNEPYQWKPTQPENIKPKEKVLTPSEVKRALEHVKTPEMAEKLAKEASEKDAWAALIDKLETPKLVQQLALNSSYQKEGNQVSLTLRNTQAHLNTEKAQSELAQALGQVLGEACELAVNIGEAGQTPLELREALYQQRLQQAHQSLASDPNVEFILNRFTAEIDSDSVRPI
ncbi:DNA polymerase III subunit gamma/tau [Vibrio sp. SCSIO 43136]|uniref:DNA polymerase III subunit gamma/tau n=1 Tax=Vibrio sp. SCSIO 43136 TaxID=2819101 RepID=UPI0020765DD0|nr:DNA polymerase III subunit gamma/tau [Vibrio sp. SCSIO 43136]USD66038.1 DNA polymerase III subunit gamma/tau [Vibrio sp. SCSIO 43136]